MKKVVFLILASFLVSFGRAQISESLVQDIDTLFKHVSDHSPGYVISVVDKGEAIFQKGYGSGNLENEIEIDIQTNFNIASLSKQITGAAVAVLMLENKLNFDDLVADYLDGFPFEKDSLRIKHLIYMTSGINDYRYNDRQNGSDWSSLNYFSIDTAILASYSSQELMYEPGTQWSYSNINYMLLTKIVEKISGMSFAEFVKTRLFEPLGMSNSLVNDDVFQVIPRRAYGYNHRSEDETAWLIESGYLTKKGEGFLQIHRNSPHYGGSGVYTTMEDWLKWVANFFTKQLGGQEFYDLMLTTMKFKHDKSNDAFGLVLDKYEGKDLIWYEGGDWGYSSFMIIFPETKTSIVCFSNLGTGNARSKVWGVYEILTSNNILR